MEIGIIGKGKMGREIFNHLFQFKHRLILICRKPEDIEGVRVSVEKLLRKMLRRGYIDDASFEVKKESFIVSDDLDLLKNCDIVIESVYEDKTLKQEIFSRLESIVKSECILATNTSSIPLKSVFNKCVKKNRCLGIHFFFPVKITKTVEINRAGFTEEKYVEMASDFITGVKKNPIILKEEANMILNKILLNMITQIYMIYEENHLSIKDIDKVLKEKLLTFGLFEIIDSTGIKIILKSVDNFIDDRHKELYTPFHIKGKKLLEVGYSGGVGNKGITDYENEHWDSIKMSYESQVESYEEKIILRLQSLLINELAFLIKNNYVEKYGINEAVKEVLGLSQDPISILEEVGETVIADCLLEEYQSSKNDIFQPVDLSVLSDQIE